jgi:hypothetical protein
MLLLFAILAYDSFMFIDYARGTAGAHAWNGLPVWLKPLIIAGPAINLVTFLGAAWQIFQHVERIREESAVQQHDRVVQIIVLPAVYSAMAMTSLTRSYLFICTSGSPFINPTNHTEAVLYGKSAIESVATTVSRSQACFYVGDLYEAWALYQFGKLVLELIESSMTKQAMTSQAAETRGSGQGLLASLPAVEQLAWLGLWSFLIVCVAESGWSLWLLTFSQTRNDGTKFDNAMAQFTVAGFLSSCAAIYNVYIVENQFHPYLPDFNPFIKFLTVKLLVGIAFFQRICFRMLMSMDTWLPNFLQKIANAIPVIKDIAHFPPVTFELFYAFLIIVECLLICIAHHFAWRSDEVWYEDTTPENDAEAEKLALLTQPHDGSYGVPKYSDQP